MRLSSNTESLVVNMKADEPDLTIIWKPSSEKLNDRSNQFRYFSTFNKRMKLLKQRGFLPKELENDSLNDLEVKGSNILEKEIAAVDKIPEN